MKITNAVRLFCSVKLFVFASLLSLTPLIAQPNPLFFPKNDKSKVVVNHRILARVNGCSISVLDVMEKMDLLFYRQFPEYVSIPAARLQFYNANWKGVLQELIDKELILADAQEIKMTVSGGDVRQEMEQMFGPNIITNLDKAGLSFEEAWKIIHSEILIRRMMHVRAQTKAFKSITPQKLRESYEVFAAENTRPDFYTYRVISIRDSDQARGAEVANLVYQLLNDEAVSFEDLPAELKKYPYGDKTQVSISEELRHTEKDVAANYKEILDTLPAKSISLPVAQKSRQTTALLFRIFYLDEKKAGGPIPFNEVEAKIRNDLIEEAIQVESVDYVKRLRQKYDVEEVVEENKNFQPFMLKQG